MLLADVTLNPNKTQKTGLKRPKSAEKQNAQIMESENVNFKGAAAAATVELPHMVTSPLVRRNSLQVLKKPLTDKLTAFLEQHEELFAGLQFEEKDGMYVSQEIRSDIATGLVDDYSDKVNEALTNAAQQAVPGPNGIKLFLTKLLKLRTETFPFNVEHVDGKIHLTTPPKSGHFFHDPSGEHQLLHEINPKLGNFIEETKLGDMKIRLSDGSQYQLWKMCDGQSQLIKPTDGSNPFEAISLLRGIAYQKIN